MKKPGFSYEEHKENADRLRYANEIINEIHTNISRKYGTSNKCTKHTEAVLNRILILRTELEMTVCRENPESIYPEREHHKIY